MESVMALLMQGVISLCPWGISPSYFASFAHHFASFPPSNLLYFPKKLLYLTNKLLQFPNRLLHFPKKILTSPSLFSGVKCGMYKFSQKCTKRPKNCTKFGCALIVLSATKVCVFCNFWDTIACIL